MARANLIDPEKIPSSNPLDVDSIEGMSSVAALEYALGFAHWLGASDASAVTVLRSLAGALDSAVELGKYRDASSLATQVRGLMASLGLTTFDRARMGVVDDGETDSTLLEELQDSASAVATSLAV